MNVFTVAEMVAAEKTADSRGNTYANMMETAGRLLAEAVQERYPVAEASILVLVGPGNNGGDGLVAGRYLAQAGADVAFYLFKDRDPQNDDNFARIQQMGLFHVTAEFDQRYRVLRTRLNITDIVIDALLGTGVSRPITGELAQLMKQVKAGVEERGANSEGRRARGEQPRALPSLASLPSPPASPPSPAIVAVDCPSGLNCDTGELDPLALAAQLTVTFAGPKRGHFIYPGAAACGELVVADIGITEEMVRDVAGEVTTAVEVVTAVTARSLLPPRPADGHKGTFGKVLIAAGSQHYWGAPVLAARAAYRAGSGLVALAVPEQIRPVMATQLPEATYPPVPDAGQFGQASAQFLLKEAASYKAMLVGPGIDDVPDFLQQLLVASETLPPLVVDADGLNLLAQMADWHKQLPANSIVTPHPGEMARLMGVVLDDLQEMDRIAIAQKQAAAWGQVVLLKGAYTVVAEPNGRCALLPFANPALGTAGSGDVLAGLIVGLRGQGMAAWEAAVLGGYLHGAAGELFGKSSGLLASEIADFVPEVMQRLRHL
ncbi:MAG: NAD(P)H-hydrate dehydratase [Ardenticatenaceae bacterium]|nr:NAD(P)H-hydrate dehydratase [Ardenticatenaceae bacterium]